MPNDGARVPDSEMPATEREVDDFLASGRGFRFDEEQPYKGWMERACNAGTDEQAHMWTEEVPFEYFELCPRLRILREFFARTAPEVVAHRYCDLCCAQFLLAYPRQGREAGLEVSFFAPGCWMYFYACAGLNEWQLQRSIERPEDAGSVGLGGHMATEVAVQSTDVQLAVRAGGELEELAPGLTQEKLARHWAAFRLLMEIQLVRYHEYTLDQRVFDALVHVALRSSFAGFLRQVSRLPAARAARAEALVCRRGQECARGLARSLGVYILWHRPGCFIQPRAPPDGAGSRRGPGHARAPMWLTLN